MKEYPEELENLMYTYYVSLSEKDKRHYAAVEAVKLGRGGINYIAELFDCNRDTIAIGLEELKKRHNSNATYSQGRRSKWNPIEHTEYFRMLPEQWLELN